MSFVISNIDAANMFQFFGSHKEFKITILDYFNTINNKKFKVLPF